MNLVNSYLQPQGISSINTVLPRPFHNWVLRALMICSQTLCPAPLLIVHSAFQDSDGCLDRSLVHLSPQERKGQVFCNTGDEAEVTQIHRSTSSGLVKAGVIWSQVS